MEVALGIVRGALFPTGEEDPDLFKGHGAHSSMVTFAATALGLVTRLGPRAVTDGACKELIEALAQELWAGTAAVDAGILAGLFSAGDAHGANAAQIQQVAGNFESVAVGAEGRQQSRGQYSAGSGKLSKRKRSG